MFAVIVIALLVCLVAVLLLWGLSPSYRKRIEEPKYRFLELQRQMAEHEDEPAATPAAEPRKPKE